MYGLLLDVLTDLKDEITLCEVCERILLTEFYNAHVMNFHPENNLEVIHDS